MLFATALGVVIAVIWASTTILIAWQSQWSGPFRDMWEIIPLLESTFDNSWNLHDFWVPYGGAHRLTLPQLVFVMDLHWLRGSNFLTLTVSLGCQFLILGLVAYRCRQAYPDAAHILWLALSIALVTLFSATQLYNLNYSISSQWFLATASSALALFIASNPPTTGYSQRRIWLVIPIGVLATISNSAGILLWPVLVWTLWIGRHPPRTVVTIALVGIIMIALYLHGMEAGLPSRQADSTLTQWLVGMGLYSLVFVTGYLASPLSRHWPAIASLLALGILIALLIDAWRQRLSQQQDKSLRVMLAGMAAHAALIAFTAGLGRTMYPGMQTTERYQTGALFFWLASALAALALAHRRGGHWRLLLPLPILMALLAFDYNNSASKHLALADTVQETHIGIALGITDMPVAIQTISHPAGQQGHNYVEWHHLFFKNQRLGPWANPLLDWHGKIAPANAGSHDCQLNVYPREAINSKGAAPVVITSQCQDSAPDALFLLSPDRRIIGMAQRSLPVWPHLLERPLQWRGYASEAASKLTAIPADLP